MTHGEHEVVRVLALILKELRKLNKQVESQTQSYTKLSVEELNKYD